MAEYPRSAAAHKSAGKGFLRAAVGQGGVGGGGRCCGGADVGPVAAAAITREVLDVFCVLDQFSALISDLPFQRSTLG